MDQASVLKQMIQFNKSAFDNTFNALEMAREQNARMIGAFLEQAAWMPEESKKTIRQWLDSYKKGCEDLRSMMNESYQRVEQTMEKQGGS